jgi:histidine triad (HIT) family protein
MDCVFCKRIQDGKFDLDDGHAVAFEPLNPVVPGHLLVVPREHVQDAGENPDVAARTMRLAAEIAQGAAYPYNLITSAGAAATQTIMHLHIHIVPRRPWDGLALPWTSQGRH